MKVLFVCLGNICRSPTAEIVLQGMVDELGADIIVDSAETAAYHIGSAPDERSQQAALKRGLDMSYLKARQVVATDFLKFDYIFAMDQTNYQNLKSLGDQVDLCGVDSKASLILFLDRYGSKGVSEVPDPYYGGSDGFELVLDLLEDACGNFLKTQSLVNI